MFTKTSLKFGGGPTSWRQFFALMGSAIAMREGTELVPEAPRAHRTLIRELQKSAQELKVKEQLLGWTNVLRQLPKQSMTRAKWFLLEQDLTLNTLQITGYLDGDDAQDELASIEKRRSASTDAVVVAISKVTQLRRAYPNYYADTTEFVAALDSALAS